MNQIYALNSILHFVQTAEKAGLPKTLVANTIEEILDTAKATLDLHEASLPEGFPATLHQSIKAGLLRRLRYGSEC